MNATARRSFALASFLVLAAAWPVACEGGADDGPVAAGASSGPGSGSGAGSGAGASGPTTTGSGEGSGAGGAGSTTTGTGTTTTSSTATSGAGGTDAGLTLDVLLDALRADRDGTVAAYGESTGWPVPVADGGAVVVVTDPSFDQVAGDFDGWAGTALVEDQGFRYLVVPTTPGSHYKLKSGGGFAADPLARSFDYDAYGEISLIAAPPPRFDRFFGIGDDVVQPRTLRIRVPAGDVTHVLYAHDGQNLFAPDAPWGGWRLQDAAPEGMLVVGIDNSPARMDEYTHVPDVLGGGSIGGLGDAYADYVEHRVMPIVNATYGEHDKIGVLGSSLGGLISLHFADRSPELYDFAASLSGTLGWGSMNADNETMIERYAAHGHRETVLYVDSGGGGDCVDADGDGIEDDGDGGDNYCESQQMLRILGEVGYETDKDVFGWFEAGAQHNEAAWAARVWRPLGVFAAL